MLRKLVVLTGLALAAASGDEAAQALAARAVAADDECRGDDGGDGNCALSARQLRGGPAEEPAGAEDADPPELHAARQPTAEEQAAIDKVDADSIKCFVSGCSAGGRGGWSAGGDKVWGAGAGSESITSGNIGYYDSGMRAARGHCGSAGCVLVMNPPGHRSIHRAHIHFFHYAGYGASLKRRLEKRVCSSPGWHGGFPCGGKAKFVSGFPGVFTAAQSGGNIHSSSTIAWPRSCGGRGTIVELAPHCSIEHQLRGDYNPRRR